MEEFVKQQKHAKFAKIIKKHVNGPTLIFGTNKDITLDIIEDNIDKNWDWCGISQNPNINIQFVLKYPTKNWHMFDLSKNPLISVEDVMNNPQIQWYYPYIAARATLEELEKYPILQRYEMGIAKNPNLDWDTICLLTNNKRQYYAVNPNSKWEIIENHLLNERGFLPIFYRSKFFNLETFLKYPNLDWEFKRISTLKGITLEIVSKFPYEGWCWPALTRRIPLDKILANQNHPWSWDTVSARRDLTWKIAEKILDRIDWRYLSANPCITPEIVKNNPKHPWNKIYLCSNPNFDLKTLLELGCKRTPVMTTNPNITYPDFKKMGLKINSHKIRLGKDFTVKCIQKWNAIAKIKKWWMGLRVPN